MVDAELAVGRHAEVVLGLLPGGSLDGLLGRESIDVVVARPDPWSRRECLGPFPLSGVVHGDLKPANVLLDGSGNAYLSDFGIAARLLDPRVVASVSSAPEFRAPEEVTSGPSQGADIFALGTLGRRLLGDIPDIEPVIARATDSASQATVRRSRS